MVKERGMTRFKLFYFLVYVSFTTHHFLNLYFREIGLSGVEIGIIKGASAIVMVFSQPIWGFLCDLRRMRKGLLNILLLAAGATFLLVAISPSFGWILCAIVVYAFFKSPIVPVADSIVMLKVKGNGRKYSQIRLWGAVGLMSSVVLMGYYFNQASLSHLFWLYLVFTYLALGLAIFLPDRKAKFQVKRLCLRDFIQLKCYPGFIQFLLAILLLQTGAFIIDGFFGLYVKERIGNEVTLGWALTLAGFSEILIYRYLGRLKRNFTAKNLLIISALISALRWYLYARSTMVTQILLLQLLHGVTFGFFYISGVTYVNQLLPDEFATSGQTFFWGNAFGLASLLGSVIGGVLYDLFNYQWLFSVAAFLAILAAGVFIQIPKEIK